jgi:Flp pilus assembly protein TadB
MSAVLLVVLAVGVLLIGRRGTSEKAGAPAAGDGTGRLVLAAGRRAEAAASRPLVRRLASGGLGLAVALMVGGPVGTGLGLVAVVGAGHLVGRLEPAGGRRRRASRATELPLVLDLLSVCLRAGMPLVAALETVADALPGPYSADLRVVAGLQRLGAAPAGAWAELADDPDLAPVTRAVARSAESGSRLAAAFDRLAADRRAALATAGLARARTAGVVAMAPLGLCFLPAFVCLGIVPVVLSLAAQVLP